MNNELELYDHNLNAFDKVEDAYATGEQIVAILQATGTGKTYIALQLAYENRNKKVLFVVPSNPIKEHIEEIIKQSKNINIEDFSSFEITTYQALCKMSREELESIDCDLLVLDEFHHIGAPKWGYAIDEFVRTHEDMRVFGMSAYSTRRRGTAYERDMANPDTDELFSGKVVSNYDICDAWIDEVLPLPNYKTAVYALEGLTQEIEEKLSDDVFTEKELEDYNNVLRDIKRRIHEAKGVKDIIKENIKPNGKYIYFCPPGSVEGVNDIETIKKEALEWFKEITTEDNIVFYTSTAEMGAEGKDNRDAFYGDKTLDGKDASESLRIMFCINQYNEGVHAPNVDGVILGRQTCSDIVYFEQIGRALSVRLGTKEELERLHQLSQEELLNICREKNILLNGNETKDELIVRITSPLIIDLVDNHNFIIELRDNLKNRIEEARVKGNGVHLRKEIKAYDFGISVENIDILNDINNTLNRLNQRWDRMYEYAKIYFEHHGDLLVPTSFRTNDGFTREESGKINLGEWIHTQKSNVDVLSPERIEKLNQIGMVFDNSLDYWFELKYELAKKYYEHYGNLQFPNGFTTNDGYTYDEHGKYNLFNWAANLRNKYNQGELSEEKAQRLRKIGMVLGIVNDIRWAEAYELAKSYYEHYGNLDIERGFRTKDGINYDPDGRIDLGGWVYTQKHNYKDNKLSEERKELLEKIGISFFIENNEERWDRMIEYAKIYSQHYGHLNPPKSFKTNDGYTFDKDGKILLGMWVRNVKHTYQKGQLSDERVKQLEALGLSFESAFERRWNEAYELVKAYYDHYGNINMSPGFKTKDGVIFDPNGKSIYDWIVDQRQQFKSGRLSNEKIELLRKVGLNLEIKDRNKKWFSYYKYAQIYYEHYGNLNMQYLFKTNDGFTRDKNGKIALGTWVTNQKKAKRDNKLSQDKIELLEKIGIEWDIKDIDEEWSKMYEYAKIYFEHYGDLNVPNGFRTNDGFTRDKDGKITLGYWVSNQKQVNKNNKLSNERKKLLEDIGMSFEIKDFDEEWLKMYRLAKIYYEHYGDSKVPAKFKTNDGFTRDNDGEYPLGAWISRQRRIYRAGNMPEERYNLLKQIDMVYNEDKDLNANTNNKFKQIEKQKLKEIKDMQNNFEENDTIQNTNIEFKDDDILKSKLFNEEDFIKKM